MPKRNNNNNRPNVRVWKGEVWSHDEPSRYYYEHDDRTGDSTRRVSFLSKNRVAKHLSRKRDLDLPVRGHLDDDDIDMAGAAFMAAKGGRYKAFKGGPGPSRDVRPGPRNRGARNVPMLNGQNRPNVLQDTDKWYKILIPYGGKYEKSYVLRILLSYISPSTFVPIAYRIHNNEASFFVDDFKAAQVLLRANKQIITTDGFKLCLKVFPGVPNVTMDDRYKEKILNAMRGRYNAETKALDLTKFHTDPSLIEDTLVAMYRPAVLSVIVHLIVENIPELVGLNLNENQLYAVDALSTLAKKTPNLRVLHLGENKLRDIRKLDCLKGLKLVELFLVGNPLCVKFSEESVYVSEVRKIFPKVIRLDGADLPPPIVFDVDNEVKLPPCNASFVCSPEGQLIAKQFLEQYFLIYDSGNRQAIGDAYHENAHFSLAISLLKGDGNHKLGHYMGENRNLMRVRDNTRRMKLLQNGKASIVAKLKELPHTKHDLASFTVDLPIFDPHLMFLNISGVFIEPKLVNMPTRYFSRTFVIVPLGSGFVIVNDLLNISNASEKQAKAAFKTPVEVSPATPVTSPAGTPVVSPQVAAASTASPVVRIIPEELKEQMMIAMCQKTSMNALWAAKCLEENQWDFDAALNVFTQLHSAQKVPPEAFIQMTPLNKVSQ